MLEFDTASVGSIFARSLPPPHTHIHKEEEEEEIMTQTFIKFDPTHLLDYHIFVITQAPKQIEPMINFCFSSHSIVHTLIKLEKEFTIFFLHS